MVIFSNPRNGSLTAETRLESSHLGFLGLVEERVGHVVDDLAQGLDRHETAGVRCTHHAAVGILHSLLGSLRNAFECAVPGLEVHH